jgi:hypothetical protein
MAETVPNNMSVHKGSGISIPKQKRKYRFHTINMLFYIDKKEILKT